MWAGGNFEFGADVGDSQSKLVTVADGGVWDCAGEHVGAALCLADAPATCVAYRCHSQIR